MLSCLKTGHNSICQCCSHHQDCGLYSWWFRCLPLLGLPNYCFLLNLNTLLCQFTFPHTFSSFFASYPSVLFVKTLSFILPSFCLLHWPPRAPHSFHLTIHTPPHNFGSSRVSEHLFLRNPPYFKGYDWSSITTTIDLKRLRDTYRIPKSVVLEVPGPRHGATNSMGVVDEDALPIVAFSHRLRLLFCRPVHDILNYLGLASTQLHPNARWILMCFCVIWWMFWSLPGKSIPIWLLGNSS